MSEDKLSYMQQLDAWTYQTIIDPLLKAGASGDTATAEHGVYKAIRDKVLESYHNGQKAGPTKPARKAPR